MRRRVRDLPPAADRWDGLAIAVAENFIDDALTGYEHGDQRRDLDSIACPVQTYIEVFDHMDKASVAGWENVCSRLEGLDTALDGYRRTLAEGIAQGEPIARRQTESVARQCRVAASDASGYERLKREMAESGVAGSRLSTRLDAAVSSAREALGDMATWLIDAYLPEATDRDGVGRERYIRAARRFLGMDLDPVATAEWGWSEVGALRKRMEDVATEISPGVSVAEALHILKTDPTRAAATHEEFVAFMKDRNSQALTQLDGTHFDVPDKIKEVDIKLANPGGALGAYYVGPTEDFSRPGAVWWNHGESQGPFPLYDEVSTLYHEGFPGHHLQVGTQVSLAEKLSRLHRMIFWLSGTGEGWALYAERLMEGLGYLDKPDYVFGYLAAQMLRACRVVIDIGAHLELKIPEGQPFHPGEEWNFDLGVELLQDYATLEKDYAESEVTRYLGWPGQAISYKVGEREILEIRRRRGRAADFDPKRFHQDILEVGPVGIDLLRSQMLA